VNRDSGRTLPPLAALVRRALVGESAIGDPDDLDRLAEGVVSALMEVTSEHAGWLLDGRTEQAVRVVSADRVDTGYYESWDVIADGSMR